MSVYPYIPKEYYPAVMFACKLIRQTRHFNRSCRVAARYYGVNESDVRKHVTARSAVGKKYKNKKAKEQK